MATSVGSNMKILNFQFSLLHCTKHEILTEESLNGKRHFLCNVRSIRSFALMARSSLVTVLEVPDSSRTTDDV